MLDTFEYAVKSCFDQVRPVAAQVSLFDKTLATCTPVRNGSDFVDFHHSTTAIPLPSGAG